MNLVGAHIAGGRDLSITQKVIEENNLETAQVFLGSPKSYYMPKPNERTDRKFAEFVEETGFQLFVHGPYIMNFGSHDDAAREKSANILRVNLERAGKIGAKGVVLHSGSSSKQEKPIGYAHVRESLLPLLDGLESDLPPVLLEPMAGQGNTLASTVETIVTYMDAVDWHPNLKVCLDTAHLLAAGEDIDTKGETTAMLDKFGELVGFDRLALIHANDSKEAKGSKKDRHETIGKGTLGLDCWREIFAHDQVTVPLTLETPTEEHQADIEKLKELRGAR